MTNPFQPYFKALTGLDVSEATEHTLRTALENLLNAIADETGSQITVIHKPKKDKSGLGAPDFKFKRHEAIVGYLENKKIGADLDAVLHSPTYRQKYRDFLKIDFPRVPFVNQRETFEALASLGWDLVQAHLLKAIPPGLNVDVTPGDFSVEKPAYDAQRERLHISKQQHFSPVPQDVWEFHIGGYQVLNQYLKARKGRTLSLNEIENIQDGVNVLRFTIDQMERIEACWQP